MSAFDPIKQAEKGVKSCIISIKNEKNKHCGHGFLIDDNHIATCAHVIAVALGNEEIKYQAEKPSEKIELTFCCSSYMNDSVLASIEEWAPSLGNDDEYSGKPCDIAILRIERKCPHDCKQPDLLYANTLVEDEFFLWGELKTTGVCSIIRGNFTGGNLKHFVQIRQRKENPIDGKIDNGFSGAPVWDVTLEGVVGMLCKAGTDKKTGYFVSNIAIKEIYKDLFTIEPEPPQIRKYRKGLSRKINDGKLPCPGPGNALELSFTTAEDNTYNTQEIFDIIKKKDDVFVILVGAAGGGKSFVTGRIIRDLAESGSNVIPVFVILGGWDTPDSDELEKIYKSDSWDHGRYDRLADIVFRKSLVSVSAELLRDFSETHEILIILDGLNEVAKGDIRDKILSSFEGYLQNTLKEPNKSYIMITDRRQHRHRSGMAQQYELKRLSASEIKRNIDNIFAEGTLENISPQCMQLLNLPYFLDLAICNHSVDFDSYSQAIYLFLRKNVGLTDENIENISEAAFSAYENTFQFSGGLSFPKKIFVEKLSPSLISRLYEAGIIEDVNSDRLKFDHQLKHDYFGARHLVNNPSSWERDSFDAISQDSGSAQALSMALELSADGKDSDKLIERIYDWNWAIAVECLIEAYQMPKKCWSHAIEFAVVAMVAEKKFDPVEHSSERSRRALDEFREDWTELFRQAKDRSALSKIVAEHALGTEWYVKWKNLFTLENWNESHLAEVFSFLADKHSLIGWCSANVLRRFPVVNENIQQELRKLYSEHTKSNPHHDAIRWRIVHVLGSLSSSENVQLLLEALSSDKYFWVKYGAARSLVEAAATAPNEELKKFVINMLTERIPDLDRTVCQEIGKTVFYRHCGYNWIKESKILLEKILKTSKTDEEKNLWNKKIECFEQGHWKKNKEKI